MLNWSAWGGGISEIIPEYFLYKNINPHIQELQQAKDTLRELFWSTL